jgi:hypothetical protein
VRDLLPQGIIFTNVCVITVAMAMVLTDLEFSSSIYRPIYVRVG